MKRKYSKEQVQEAVSNSISYSDVFRNLGIGVNGGSYPWIKKLIKEYEISVDHFETRRELLIRMGKKANENLKNEAYGNKDMSNGERISGSKLRRFLNFHGFEEICSNCNLTEWLGVPLRLDIHHKDGDCTNNKLENLCFICPNCHRQETIEYRQIKHRTSESKTPKKTKDKPKIKKEPNRCLDCSTEIKREAKRCKSCSAKEKSKPKIQWPDKSELEKIIWEFPLSTLGDKWGVSGNAIKKHCQKIGIEKFPDNRYWGKKRAEK